MEQRLYVPPPVTPTEDGIMGGLSDLLGALELQKLDIHGEAWQARKFIEEGRYAKVSADSARSIVRNFEQHLEEHLDSLLEGKQKNENKQDAESRKLQSTVLEGLKKRLPSTVSSMSFLTQDTFINPPDTLSKTLGAKDDTKPPPNLGKGDNPPSSKDTFYSPPNEEFIRSDAYKPLIPQFHEFRLLRLLPGGWDEDIRCELVGPYPIAEASYFALSYAAGNFKEVRRIFVNGIQFWVYDSLFRALWQIRTSTATQLPALFWIDQICINQHDPHEKAQQVLFMRHIYYHASKTLVWLGEQDNNSLGMTYLKELAKRHQEHEKTETERLTALHEQGLTCSEDSFSIGMAAHAAAMKLTAAWLVNQALDDTVSKNPLTALLEMFESKWWSRCWVVQELALSNSPVMMWGRANETWGNFKTVSHLLQFASKLLYHEIRLQNPAVKPIHARFASSMYNQGANDMRILRAAWKYAQGTELRHALCIARTLQSTDPRDRVFSFLGLLKNEYGIIPNYKLGTKPAQVFHEATVKSILEDHSLNILCDREPRSSETDVDLPSWVPNFSRRLSRRGLVDWHFQQKFSASADLVPDFELKPSETGQRNCILCVKAIVLHPELKASDFNTVKSNVLLANMLMSIAAEAQEDGNDALNGSGMNLLRTILFDAEDDGVRVFLEYMLKDSPLFDRVESSDASKQDGKEIKLAYDGKSLQEVEERLTLEDAYHRFRETWPSADSQWLLLTTEKFHALVPRGTKVGDILCVVFGASAPLVIRPLKVEEEDTSRMDSRAEFRLIGPAYVHGYMHGRAVEEYQQKMLEEKWFELV